MVKVVIDVTARDIKQGVALSAIQCPIARAAKRAGLKKANIAGQFIESVDGEIAYPLPAAATQFVDRFDSYDDVPDVKPFKFTLRLSDANAKLLGYKAPKAKAA